MSITRADTTPSVTTPIPRQVRYIIGNEGCERFSYYGMRNILTVFLVTSLLQHLPEADRAQHGAGHGLGLGIGERQLRFPVGLVEASLLHEGGGLLEGLDRLSRWQHGRRQSAEKRQRARFRSRTRSSRARRRARWNRYARSIAAGSTGGGSSTAS